MPRFTPHVKVERTREHGAEVILAGETFDDAKAAGHSSTRARTGSPSCTRTTTSG